MRKSWWKILSVILLLYAFAAGLNVFDLPVFQVPRLPIINESIRNLYYHVSMWFAMMILFVISVVHAIQYLSKGELKYDILSRQYAVVGMLFGVLGYATGAIWAAFTWADPNGAAGGNFAAIAREPKLIGAAIALLIYAAYLVLRDSINDIDKKARISAVYNIFAFAFLFPSIWIIPRLLPSLHPGGEGSDNPGIDPKSLDWRMRIVFYPAIAGWTLLGVWMATLKVRLMYLKQRGLLETDPVNDTTKDR
ncbi:cytochrome c biogenesis protein CcsA [Flaviaesturariibacter amylovorans]|uniref:Cytochrome c biogenesis protein CcsA n=2 Tax=Flaviaesturariibacter amylovorans TaxID=1084520 RepID=A0ABP8GK98_9BACT